jgi:hypothetical protein
MDLNYSALEAINPKRKKSEYTDIPKFGNFAGASILTIIIFLFLATTFRASVLFAPIVFYFLYKNINQSGKSAIRLSNFAIDNKFTYRWGVKGTNSFRKIKFGGVIGASSSDIPASNLINGKYKDFNFQLFNPFTKGNFTVMKVELKNHYPHIVLDSTAEDPYFGDIGKFFSEDSRIHLEGDFDNYFKVYAKADAVDSLRILSPDMMALMIDSGHKYDIEIFENNLHIISNFKYSNKENVKNFFDVADVLLDKLDRRSTTVQADFDSESRVE